MTLRTCAETQIAAGADPGSCLAEAHAPCLAEDISAPAAVALCFAEAERSWGGAIASLLVVKRQGAESRGPSGMRNVTWSSLCAVPSTNTMFSDAADVSPKP